jgi:D-citramalate synthase
VPVNKPVSGSHVFVNAAGVHADGDVKGDLYLSGLRAERFGAEHSHSLGKLSGRASVVANLKKFGFSLKKGEIDAVAERVLEFGESRHRVTPADLLYLVAEVLNRPEIVAFDVVSAKTESNLLGGARCEARVLHNGEDYRVEGHGTGGLDAFLDGLRKWASAMIPSVSIPEVLDYEIDIPPGGTSSALVEAIVTWRRSDGSEFMTTGLHEDQVMAGIRAAQAAVNLVNLKRR